MQASKIVSRAITLLPVISGQKRLDVGGLMQGYTNPVKYARPMYRTDVVRLGFGPMAFLSFYLGRFGRQKLPIFASLI